MTGVTIRTVCADQTAAASLAPAVVGRPAVPVGHLPEGRPAVCGVFRPGSQRPESCRTGAVGWVTSCDESITARDHSSWFFDRSSFSGMACSLSQTARFRRPAASTSCSSRNPTPVAGAPIECRCAAHTGSRAGPAGPAPAAAPRPASAQARAATARPALPVHPTRPMAATDVSRNQTNEQTHTVT